MKKLLLAATILALPTITNAQMTHQRDYNNVNSDVLNDADSEMDVINLSISGTKYLIRDMQNSQIKIYNLDHSIWKTINLPSVTNYAPNYSAFASEELFNPDSKLELAVYYYSTQPNVFLKKLLIIDENGNTLNTIDSAGAMKVYNTGNNKYVAVLPTGNMKYSVYALPGTIPNGIGNGLGLAKNIDLSKPYPNPSTGGTVRIDYNIPEGINNAHLDIYTSSGIRLKSYNIDNTFSNLVINTSDLPPGTYFYNVVIEGDVSETQKIVVLK